MLRMPLIAHLVLQLICRSFTRYTGKSPRVKSQRHAVALYKYAMSTTYLASIQWLRSVCCQKSRTGEHCNVRISKKARPTVDVSPMTIYRTADWRRRTVRRRRSIAMEIRAVATVQT